MEEIIKIQPFSHGHCITTEFWENGELVKRDVRIEVTKGFTDKMDVSPQYLGDNYGDNSRSLQ